MQVEDNKSGALAKHELDPVQELRSWLEIQGADPPCDELSGFLSRVWNLFEGSYAGAMQGYKLLNDRFGVRIEEPHWIPPTLEFNIVRHGAVALGSKRGDLQHWRLNFDLRTACYTQAGHRNVREPEPRIDVHRIARDLARIVASDGFSDDPRIKQLPGNRLVIVVNEIPELTNVVAQTKASRRKRFRQALADAMLAVGFQLDIACKGKRAGYQFLRNVVG